MLCRCFFRTSEEIRFVGYSSVGRPREAMMNIKEHFYIATRVIHVFGFFLHNDVIMKKINLLSLAISVSVRLLQACDHESVLVFTRSLYCKRSGQCFSSCRVLYLFASDEEERVNYLITMSSEGL